MAKVKDTQSKLSNASDCDKTCKKCGQTKNKSEFYVSHRKGDYVKLEAFCKECSNKCRTQRWVKVEHKRKVDLGIPINDRAAIRKAGEKRRLEIKRKSEAYQQKLEAKREAEKRRLPVIGVVLKCAECDENVIRIKFSERVYCSKNCRWRALRRNRRARKALAYIEAVDLGELANRDNWVCQLCGEKVTKDAEYKRQATIDHVIPLSKGGLHHMDNCQLAHFNCDSKKHDKVSALL